ncbi:MAG TPA: hypothetical protein VL546_01975 [Steroidobacteraceae bacterium]|jgi:hypothetical protein|nr:hypothetical protein [Steroidobacteraceae bacterium]
MIEERDGRGAKVHDELAATRAELRDVLLPAEDDTFPRSATMRALTGRGTVSVLALVGMAVLATRPGVAGRLARAAPVINLLRQLGLTPR